MVSVVTVHGRHALTTIENANNLRTLYRQPGQKAIDKVIGHLDDHCRRFIGMSPFCVLGTATPDGDPDLSPRGGDPGFVHIFDDHTLLLADRPGNNRLDTLGKLVANPAISMLFFVPGIDETLRVYGDAAIEPTGQYAGLFGINDGKSVTVMRVSVSRAMFHCPKALMRSRLWEPAAQIDNTDQPTIYDIMNDQAGSPRDNESRETVIQRLASSL